MSAGVPSCTGEPSPTSVRTIASPSCRSGISSGCRIRALGETCLSFRARFTQNSTPRNSVSPRPSSISSSPMPSACQAPLPVRSARSAPSDRRARSIVPFGPVLWPVLAEPSITYHRLSNPRWGCFVSTFPTSDSFIRPSCTRRNGSTCAYGTVRDGNASSTGNPIMRISAASSTTIASRAVVSISRLMLLISFVWPHDTYSRPGAPVCSRPLSSPAWRGCRSRSCRCSSEPSGDWWRSSGSSSGGGSERASRRLAGRSSKARPRPSHPRSGPGDG